MEVIKPPTELKLNSNFSLFLAGSIEMGVAKDWQQDIQQKLKDLDINILNPRRDDFNKNCDMSMHDTYFFGQVDWELKALEIADCIFFHFEPETMSPITLLEFGLYAKNHKVVVHCPNGFWRKGNVDIVANRYGTTVVETIEEAINEIKNRINEHSK